MEQSTLENGNEETRKPYIYICSNTSTGFLNLLNENAEKGYRVDRDMYSETHQRDNETNESFIKREAYLYDTESTGLDSEETSLRRQIIGAVIDAENYLFDKKSLLEDRERYILLNINWDDVNSERKEKGLSKISNEKQRTAFINTDKPLLVLKKEVQEAEQWLKLVKKYETLHELPTTKAPWIIEEEKATAKEEAESKGIVPEKVRNIGEMQKEDIISEDMGMS